MFITFYVCSLFGNCIILLLFKNNISLYKIIIDQQRVFYRGLYLWFDD